MVGERIAGVVDRVTMNVGTDVEGLWPLRKWVPRIASWSDNSTRAQSIMHHLRNLVDAWRVCLLTIF